ncbi:hypothetical protein P7K49_025893 [Saguinus oedipus]|uniref:Uncharacterized protein n=1 Tax=Saguinus oedipus TaxID=9490 RepID=A0ABQ9UIH0_SAGOE|nr:hypothetical protein P7K49_025893 [Saguinus oedipus]
MVQTRHGSHSNWALGATESGRKSRPPPARRLAHPAPAHSGAACRRNETRAALPEVTRAPTPDFCSNLAHSGSSPRTFASSLALGSTLAFSGGGRWGQGPVGGGPLPSLACVVSAGCRPHPLR